jgi:uracil phosphoribosyltransferase
VDIYNGRPLTINFIGEDAEGQRLVESMLKAGEQLQKGFSATAPQHSVGAILIGSSGHTTHGMDYADSDLAVLNELRDVGQRQGGC